MTRNMLKIRLVALFVLFCHKLLVFHGTLHQPKQEQIDKYIQEHPDLPDLDKSCIYDGRFGRRP